jgi:hypothetical protein
MKNALVLVRHPASLNLDGDFIDNVWKTRFRSGEQRLMLAILKEALDSFFKHLRAADGRGKAIYQEVEGWIREKDNDWIFSFENVCESVGINASYLRAGLCRRMESEPARRPRFYATEEKLAAAGGG